jgi:hypothetical protein
MAPRDSGLRARRQATNTGRMMILTRKALLGVSGILARLYCHSAHPLQPIRIIMWNVSTLGFSLSNSTI